MNIFDYILIQPIFNVLVVIYGLIPGNDFGLALIAFTILVRLAMWPLVKKQLHQTKVMRSLQPDLAKIKQKAKGNKQQESLMMMELYKEKGINPFGSIGLLLVQLPIFIALFAVVRLITENHANIAKYTYDFLEGIPAIQSAIGGHFNESLLGLIDLTKAATAASQPIYWPLLIMAVVAAILQFIQSKQLLPKPAAKRRLRDMLKEQAAGKEVDQSEMSALVTNRMIWLFPVLTFVVSIYLAGALVLYLITQSAVAILQQARALKGDEPELEKLSQKAPKNKKDRAKEAKTAEVVKEPAAVPATPAKKAKKAKKNKRK